MHKVADDSFIFRAVVVAAAPAFVEVGRLRFRFRLGAGVCADRVVVIAGGGGDRHEGEGADHTRRRVLRGEVQRRERHALSPPKTEAGAVAETEAGTLGRGIVRSRYSGLVVKEQEGYEECARGGGGAQVEVGAVGAVDGKIRGC